MSRHECEELKCEISVLRSSLVPIVCINYARDLLFFLILLLSVSDYGFENLTAAHSDQDASVLFSITEVSVETLDAIRPLMLHILQQLGLSHIDDLK